jgi:cell division protein FtsZ
MLRMGMAIMGTGVARGENRAKLAATAAISSPLLEDASVQGARGVIINVTGGPDLTLAEVSEASDIIYSAAHEDANIIWAVVDPKMEGKVKITVIATVDYNRAPSPAAQATKDTPIDMSAYLARTSPRNGSSSMAVRGVAEAGLDLPKLAFAPCPIPMPGRPMTRPLDVPAFMRKRIAGRFYRRPVPSMDGSGRGFFEMALTVVEVTWLPFASSVR